MSETSPVYNPSTGEVIALTPMCTAAHVNDAVQAAEAAFTGWWETPPVERARVLFRFKMMLEEKFEEIARCNTREHGKTLIESRGDVRRGIEMVEFACGVPSLLSGETIENVARGIDCETIRQPLGVCVGITPFNFPAMVPLWMYPVALACGNTFVLKPSEKVPLTAMMIARLLEQAGLPRGVFNIVHGGRECVEALLDAPKSQCGFVCRFNSGRALHLRNRHASRQTRAGKRQRKKLRHRHAGRRRRAFDTKCYRRRVRMRRRTLHGQLNCGRRGKRIERCSAFAGSGAKTIRVGPTDREPQPDMGPLITRQHRDRVAQLVGTAAAEGAKILIDGRGLQVNGGGFFLGATVLDEVQNGMTVAREEIFGPVLNVMRADNLESAMETINCSPYGNGASIFTRSGKAAREFKHRVKAGMVGINIGVPASMAWFPFAGWGDSFFGDLHMQGREGVQFFTQQKVTTTRWFAEGEGNIWSTK